MTVITEADVRTLAAVRSSSDQVTSCYLDVDGSTHVRPADYERYLDQMVRRLRDRGDVDDSVAADLARIQARVAEGFDRSHVRGVALFACGVQDLFIVHELPVPVRNQLLVNRAPAVGQLELVVQHASRLAILAADRQHARVFVSSLGEMVEHVERTDELPRDYDDVGVADRGDVADHRDELIHQHLRAAAELAWQVHQDTGFDHLVLAASAQVAAELEGLLHPYLRDRLHGRIDLAVQASEGEVRAAALDAERAVERAREAAVVAELREAVAADGRAVAGIEGVLDALAQKRVDRLVVSDGFSREGWLCPTCDRLATVGRTCSCGAEMAQVADLIEEAVDAAFAQSARVEVCAGDADLDVLGRIGALLRY